MAIGMMLHELATNAAKYGALSLSSGTVRVSWITQNGLQPLLHLEWSETGGPPVEKSARRGFGSRLIERGLARELNAHVDLVFDPSGVRCTMDMPLAPDTGEA
jgi:two-component sensor histidine kinase